MEQVRKQYTPPTLVEHGKVEEETKGLCNYMWEPYGMQSSDPAPIKP